MVTGVSISMKNGFVLDPEDTATSKDLKTPPSPRARRKEQMRHELAMQNGGQDQSSSKNDTHARDTYHSEKELVRLHANPEAANSKSSGIGQTPAAAAAATYSPHGRARAEASRHPPGTSPRPTGAARHPHGASPRASRHPPGGSPHRHPPGGSPHHVGTSQHPSKSSRSPNLRGNSHATTQPSNTRNANIAAGPHNNQSASGATNQRSVSNIFQNNITRRPKTAPRSYSARSLPNRPPPQQQLQKSKASSASQLIKRPMTHSRLHHHHHEPLSNLPTLSSTDEYEVKSSATDVQKTPPRPERAAAIGKGVEIRCHCAGKG